MDNRPLSPHLTVYKPQITSVLSIFHRITGAGLSVGTVLVVLWLASVAAGENAFNNFFNPNFMDLTSQGLKISTPSTCLVKNSAAYPDTPASIGLPVAAYSKIFEGMTLWNDL